MSYEEIKETLEKQLQLLSERSAECDARELPQMTQALLDVYSVLSVPSSDSVL